MSITTIKKYSAYGLLIIIAMINLSCDTVTDNNPVNQLSSLKVLDFYASRDDLENMYNNRFTDLVIPAKVNAGKSTLNCSMKASGAGSRYFPKYSYRVMLQEGDINRLSDFNISAQVFDKTMIKTLLALYLYRKTGFTTFYSEPVFCKMNNENLGLYSLIERVDPFFFTIRGMNIYELYQVQFDARFTFEKRNNVKRSFKQEIPDNENYENLETMIHAVDTVSPSGIFTQLSRYIDVYQYLRYHAITSIRHDPDAFTNNFFLYKETPEDPFRVLPWDFDKTFDIVGSVGFSGRNELIDKLFLNDECRKYYADYMRFILDQVFTEENLYPIIDEYAAKIEPFFKYDPYLNESNFNNEVEFLKKFITQRRAFIVSELAKFR